MHKLLKKQEKNDDFYPRLVLICISLIDHVQRTSDRPKKSGSHSTHNDRSYGIIFSTCLGGLTRSKASAENDAIWGSLCLLWDPLFLGRLNMVN